jgi:phage-related protein
MDRSAQPFGSAQARETCAVSLAKCGAISARLCTPPSRAKPIHRQSRCEDLEGGSVLEIVADQEGGTWRAVYTVRYPEAVYVLHAFQKKSKRGIATPKRDMDLIHRRLGEAERLHRERQN